MKGLGPLPRIHPRETKCREAENDLRTALVEWGKKHRDLTTAEHMQVVTSVLSNEMLGVLKYEIRHERHGNTDKPGGLE